MGARFQKWDKNKDAPISRKNKQIQAQLICEQPHLHDNGIITLSHLMWRADI